MKTTIIAQAPSSSLLPPTRKGNAMIRAAQSKVPSFAVLALLAATALAAEPPVTSPAKPSGSPAPVAASPAVKGAGAPQKVTNAAPDSTGVKPSATSVSPAAAKPNLTKPAPAATKGPKKETVKVKSRGAISGSEEEDLEDLEVQR
jgi:hypothetical protein